jgi:hypothetical protein
VTTPLRWQYAETADVHGVHQLGAPGDGGERQAAGDALRGRHQVRHDRLVVDGEPVAGATEAGLDLVGDEHHAVLLRPGGERGQEPRRRYDEAALALDRLDDQAGEVLGADLLVEHVDRAGRGLLAGQPVTQRVRHRRAVDLAGERAEAVLVRHVLRGHRHRQVGAAVVRVVEDRHRVASGGHARDLHGVLDGLGARVEQGALLRVVAGGELGERGAHVHVAVVRRDHEAGVGERLDLRGDVPDHRRCRVADRGHGDAGPEVDQRVPVHVDEDAAPGRDHEHRQHRADAVRDVRLLAVQALQRAGARDLGDEAALLGERGPADSRFGHASKPLTSGSVPGREFG